MSSDTETEAEKPAGPKAPMGPLILGLLNTIVILAAVGMLAYTKLVFKRPPITEEGEREKIEALKSAPKASTVHGYVQFDPVTINISAIPTQPKNPEGSGEAQVQGKLHYATIGFSLELPDVGRKEELESIKPLIADQFLALTGRKQFHELTSVQGRYVLKTQMIEIVNNLANKRLAEGSMKGPLVSDLYFNQFIVQ
jgi:flagellar basal body-associated protein FliL